MQGITIIPFSQTNYNTFDSYNIMSVRIIVKLSENIVLNPRSQQLMDSPELEELSKIQRSIGITLEPVHPRTKDPSLASYFTVEVPDEGTANKIIEHLKLCKEVDGAYIKPSDELPGATI